MADGIQTLKIIERLFPFVLNGEKTSTIRWRELHISPGLMRYICARNPSRTTVVDVFKCTDMLLSDAAAFLGKAEEWPEQVMLRGMREHYPEIELFDIVQVIEHRLPE